MYTYPYVNLCPKNVDIKIGTTPVDAPRRDLSIRGLNSVVASLVCRKIHSMCVNIEDPRIQL